MRDVLVTPCGKDWPIVKREVARRAELRRAMMQAGWFNERRPSPRANADQGRTSINRTAPRGCRERS